MISHKLKYYFVHIPKCAGSSIERALGEAEGVTIKHGDLPPTIKEKYLLMYPDEKHRFNIGPSQHFPIRHINNYYPEAKEYFTFTFVRNPWDRIVSEYHWFKHQSRKRKKKRWASITFDEFIEGGNDVPLDRYHDKSQYWFICDDHGQCAVDVVGRFETLHEDFDKICKEIGIRQELPHVFKADRGHYMEYYNENTKQTVAERFAVDIDMFGYTFEGDI
jgi:chondroitin 4-sulfotransferase 11